MGPLGLSGSLFLGLLVLDFYHPTNRDLYLVRGGGHTFGLIFDTFQCCLEVVIKLFGL